MCLWIRRPEQVFRVLPDGSVSTLRETRLTMQAAIIAHAGQLTGSVIIPLDGYAQAGRVFQKPLEVGSVGERETHADLQFPAVNGIEFGPTPAGTSLCKRMMR